MQPYSQRQAQQYQVGQDVQVTLHGKEHYAKVMRYDPTQGYELNIDYDGQQQIQQWTNLSKISPLTGTPPTGQAQAQPPTGPGTNRAPQGTAGSGDALARDALSRVQRLEANLQKEQVERDRVTKQLEESKLALGPLKETKAMAQAQLQETTELNEEVRAALAGLHEIGDYAGAVRDIETEVVDTRGAVESMMDMLEKTLTIKDGNALLDDQEARFDEKMHQSTEGMRVLEDELSNVNTKMDTVAADLMKVAHEVSRHGEADALRLTEKIGGVESKLAEGLRSTTTKISSLETRLDKREQIWKAELDAAKSSFSKELQSQAAAHNQELARLQETSAAAQKKLADDLARQVKEAVRRVDVSERSSETQFARLDDLCSHLDEKIATSSDTLEQKLGAASKRTDDTERELGLRCQTVERAVQELKDTVHQCKMDVQSTETSMSSKLEQEIRDCEDRLRKEVERSESQSLSDLQKYASDAQIRDVEVDRLLSSMETNITKVQDDQVQIRKDVRESIDQTTAQLQQNVESLQQQTDKVFADVKAGEADVTMRLDDVIKQINSAMQVNTDNATAALAEAAGSLSNRLDEQDRLLDQQHKQDQTKVGEIARNIHEHQLKVDGALNSLDAQLKKTHGDLAKTIDDEAKKSEKQSKGLEAKTAKTLGEHDKRLDDQKRGWEDARTKLEKDTERKMRELEAKIAAEHAYADELHRTGDRKIDDTAAILEKKLGQGLSESKGDAENLRVSVLQLNDDVVQLREGVHALDDSTNNHFANVDRACENLGTTIDKSVAEIDGQLSTLQGNAEVLQQQIGDVADNAQLKLSDEINGVTAQVEAVGNAVDLAHQQIADAVAGSNAKIEEGHAAFAKMCSDLEQKMRGENSAQDDRSELVRQDVNAYLDKLDKKHAELTATTDERFTDVQKQLGAEVTGMKQLVADSASVFDKRVADQKLTATQDAKRLSDACAALEKKATQAARDVETRTGSLDKEIKANQKQLTQRCESLEKTVASEAASQKARSEAVATDSAAARGRIEERLTTTTNEHHQKLLDISTALAQAASEAKAQIVKEEKQLEAAAAKLDKRADLLSGVVEANLSNSLAAVASLDTKLSSDASNRDIKIRELESAIQHTQADAAEDCKRVADALAQNMHDVKSQYKQLQDSVATDSKRTESMFESKMEAQNTRIGNEKAHFGELLASAEKMFETRCASLEGSQTILGKSIKANETLMRDSCSQLDGRISSVESIQTTRVDKMQAHFEDVCQQLEKKLTSDATVAQTAIEQRLSDLSSELTDESAKLDVKVTELRSDHDGRLTELKTAIEHNYSTLDTACKTLDKKAASVTSALNERVQNNHQHFTNEFAKLDSQSAMKDDQHDAKLDGLSQAMVAQESKLTEMLQYTQTNLEGKDQAQDARLDEQQRHFADLIEKLDSKLSEKDAKQDEELHQLATTAIKHHSQFEETISALDAKLGDNAVQWEQDAKHFAALTADLEREFHAEQTENTKRIHEVKDRMAQIDANWHEAESKLGVDAQAQSERIEHKFDEEAQRLATNLTTVEKQIDSRIKAEHNLVLSKCHALEKESSDVKAALEQKTKHLDVILSEYKEHMRDTLNGITHTVEQHYNQLTETDKLADEKINQKCEELAYESSSIRKYFDEVCLNLEFKFTEKNLAQDNKYSELEQREQENYSQITGMCVDLESRLNAESVAVKKVSDEHFAHFTKITGEMDETFTQRMQNQGEHLTEICRGLSTTLTTQYAALDEKFTSKAAAHDELMNTQYQHLTAATERADQKVDQKVEEMRQSVASTIEHLTAINTSLDQKIVERQTTMETKFSHKNEEQDIRIQKSEASLVMCNNELGLLNDFLSPLDERVNQHYAHFEEVVNEINSKFLAWSAPMEVRMDDAVRAHETDRHQLSERITEVTATFTGRCDALGAAQNATDALVNENNTKAMEFLNQLDNTGQEMHAHFTEICAALDVKIVNQVTDVQAQVRSEHEHFTGICASLDEKFTVATEATDNRVAAVSDIVTENHRQFTHLYDGMDKKFGGIVAQHETRIGNLSSALNDSNASLKALLVKLEADLKAEVNTRAEKMNTEHVFFTAALAKVDEKHSAKTAELSTKYDDVSRLLTQKTQGLAQANDALEQKFFGNVQRIDAVMKDLPGEIVRNRQEAAARSDKIELTISDSTMRVEAKADMDRQHFTERCDSLDKNVVERATALSATIEEVKVQLESTSTAAMSAFKSMHSEHKQRLDKHEQVIDSNAKTASVRHTELQEKLIAEITAQTERIANHSKHFAATVANVEQSFSDQHAGMGQRIAEIAGRVAEYKAQSDGEFRVVGEKIAEEKAAQIARVTDTADAFRSTQKAMAKQSEEGFAAVKQEHRSLVEQCASDKRELGNTCTRIERNLTTQGEDAQQRLDAQRTDLVAMLTESDRRFQTATSAHDTSISKLSDHVDANIQRLLTAHAGLEGAFDEERATQTGRIEDHKQYFEEMFESVKSEFNTRSIAEETRVNELIEREHEHFTDALVSLDRKVSNENLAQTTRIAELNESMGEQAVQTRDVMEALDEKFTQGLTTQKETIEKHHQDFTEVMAMLDEKYQDISAAAENRANQLTNEVGTALDQQKDFARDLTMLKGKNDAQDERIDDVSTVMDQHHTHFTDVCAMLDTKLRDAANVSAAEIERAQKEVMRHCTQLDAKFIAEKDSTTERLENHHRHFTQVCNQVDASSESRASAAETRIAETLTTMEHNSVMFNESVDAIDKKLSDTSAAQEGRMRDQNKHFADICAGLESKGEANVRQAQQQFAQTCAQMDLKLVEWTKEADMRMDTTTTQLSDHHRHFTAVCTKLDMQLGEETEALKSHLVNTEEHLGGSIAQVERRLAQSEADQEERCAGLSDAMQKQEGRFTEVCGKLDRVMTEQIAGLQDKVTHEHAHAEELSVALDRKFSDRLDEQDTRMDEASKTTHDHHRYFTSICEQLDRKFSDAATAQREQLQAVDLSQETAQKQLTHTLTTKVTDTLKSHDERLTQQHVQFTEVLSEQDRKFSEACVNLDAKVSEELRLRDSQAKEDRTRFSELCAQTSRAAAEELTKTNTKFTDVCIGLDEKFSKGASELKVQLQSDFSKLEESLTSSSNGLKTRLGAEMKSLDEKMTDSIIGLDQKAGVLMDEQASRVDKVQKYLTDENSKLRQQLNSRAAELDGKIQESCDAVSTTLLRRAEETESKVAAMAATTTQRADEIERTSKQAVDKLTSGLGNAEKKAASDLQRDVGVLQEKLEVRMAAIERRQTDLKEKAAEDQDALETRTRDDLGRLGTTLGALETKHEALAEEATRTSRETSRRIDQMKTELDNKIDMQGQLHTALETETGRNDKKRRDEISDGKRSTEGKLDAMKATIEVNIDQRLKAVEEKMRPLESAVLVGQRAATDVSLMRLEVDELKGIVPMIQDVQEENEKLEDKMKQQFSELEVDVQILQATQQAL
jgi:hypothetical protein